MELLKKDSTLGIFDEKEENSAVVYSKHYQRFNGHPCEHSLGVVIVNISVGLSIHSLLKEVDQGIFKSGKSLTR